MVRIFASLSCHGHPRPRYYSCTPAPTKSKFKCMLNILKAIASMLERHLRTLFFLFLSNHPYEEVTELQHFKSMCAFSILF